MIASASDFCQRWRARRHSWRHQSEGGFDARRYEVAPLAESEARTFVELNHYSASYPAARLRFGLYDGAWLVGVAVLGVPIQRRVLTTVFPDLEPSRRVDGAEQTRARRIGAGRFVGPIV